MAPPKPKKSGMSRTRTPHFVSIAGVVGTVGNGKGTGPGQFNEDEDEDDDEDRATGMYQVAFGLSSTVWAADCHGHRLHHFKQSGELIKTIGTGTAGDKPGKLRQPGASLCLVSATASSSVISATAASVSSIRVTVYL